MNMVVNYFHRNGIDCHVICILIDFIKIIMNLFCCCVDGPNAICGCKLSGSIKLGNFLSS